MIILDSLILTSPSYLLIRSHAVFKIGKASMPLLFVNKQYFSPPKIVIYPHGIIFSRSMQTTCKSMLNVMFRPIIIV